MSYQSPFAFGFLESGAAAPCPGERSRSPSRRLRARGRGCRRVRPAPRHREFRAAHGRIFFPIAPRVKRKGSATFPFGIYHLTASGATSWQEYAVFIVQKAIEAGFDLKAAPEKILPIPASAYPLPATRPENSRLDCGLLEKNLPSASPSLAIGGGACLEVGIAIIGAIKYKKNYSFLCLPVLILQKKIHQNLSQKQIK